MPRWLRRIFERVIDDPAWFAEIDSAFGPPRFAGCNDELWRRERDPERLRAAYSLWTTDPTGAFAAFRDYASAGSVWSMGQVAHAYAIGRGTAASWREAEAWDRRALAEGDANAALRLAWRYANECRYEDAEAVLHPLLHRSDPAALYWLAAIKRRRRPRRWEWRDEARSLLERATASGHLQSKRYLASLYLGGSFGPRLIPAGLRLALDVYREIEVRAERARSATRR